MKNSFLTFTIAIIALAWISKSDVNPVSAQEPRITFRDVTKPAGLIEPLAGMMGHGGAWGDYDGDGWIDIFVGGFCDRPNEAYKPASGPVGNRLLRNLGNGKFQRIKQPGIEYYGRTSGAVFADLDNDGDLDLYAANNAKTKTRHTMEPQKSAQVKLSMFFANNNGKLVDISDKSGAVPKDLHTARNIGVFDYDNDGLLDLFVVEDRFTKEPGSVLLRNKGNLQFEDVTARAGLPDDIFGLGIAVADLNGDNRPDFFVPHSNRMFLSQGTVKYTEPATLKEFFAWTPQSNEDWPCGAAFGDLNRDGLLDLVLTIHAIPARNRIYLNKGLKNGIPQFEDVTKAAGFDTPVPVRCPHVEIQDFDNDGRPDIYTTAAWMDADKQITPLVFRNLGLKNGIPQFQPPRPIKGPMVYYPAGPSGDYDKDGRIDLFLINWFEDNYSRLLRNKSSKKHWLNVRVVGKKINRMGIGSKVSVYREGQLGKKDGLLGHQELTTGYGYASGQPAVCHFGLDNYEIVDVVVQLPNGRRMKRRGVKADQTLVIEE